MKNLPMRIILVLLCSFNLISCISSVVTIGCGASALSMPSNDPVTFTANLSVKTAEGISEDEITYTCEVKERKCVGGNWKRSWIDRDIPPFNVILTEKYHASVTAPSCRLSRDMAINDNFGYTQVITVFNSTTNKQVYRATDRNSELKNYGFESLSVTVK